MRAMFTRILAALAAIMCLSCAALAEYKWPIDVDALKALEAADEFGVRITKKTVHSSDNAFLYNGDTLTLSVTNASDAAISQLVVLLVPYDDDNMKSRFEYEPPHIEFQESHRREIIITTQDVNMLPGDTYNIMLSCQRSYFKSVRALVYMVVTADGQTFVNPIGDDWYELAMGSPTHILD